MSIPFISQTIANSEFIPAVGETGRWNPMTADVLERIAKATPNGAVSLSDLAQSVPSVWGYARLFFAAWDDPAHGHHAEVVELWRRFVCLVALRDRRGGDPLTLKPIELPALPPGRPADGASARSFKYAASLQWPHELFGTERTKSVTVVAVLFDGATIGLLVPGMAALPSPAIIEARTCPVRLRDIFPLEELAQPDRPDFYRHWLPGQRLGELQSFLLNAINLLGGWGNDKPPRLVERLTEFHRDVVAGAGGLAAAGANWTRSTAFTATRIHEQSAIQLFDFTLIVDVRAQRAVVQIRNDVATAAQGAPPDFVLVSAHVERADYRGLAVDAKTRVGDLAGRHLNPETRQALASSDNPVHVISEAELFEPTLIRLAGNAPYAEHGRLGQYLLPVTPLALALLGRQGLLAGLSLAENTADEVTVTLTVPLKMSTVPEVSLSKTYRRTDGTIMEAKAPTSFAVWPDFPIPPWSGNELRIPTLVYQSIELPAGAGGGELQFNARQLLWVGNMQEMLNGCKDAARLAAPPALKPKPDADGAALTMLQASRARHDLLFAPASAEAIQCAAGSHHGILLIAERDPRTLAINFAERCEISIDFGTSSTTVAFQRLGRDCEVGLSPHIWLPFHGAEVEAALRNQADMELLPAFEGSVRNFIPPVNLLGLPFLSILQVRGRIDQERTHVPLLRGCVPFIRETGIDKLTEMILAPLPGTEIEVNLKWQGDRDRRELVRHFLREVMLLALGHARGLGTAPQNVSWRLSMPKSMPSAVQQQFKADATAAYVTALGTQPTAEKLRFPPESEAIYYYLLKVARAAAPITAILDVGGRSTDIAILNGGKFSADGSADLAGRVLLVDYWVERWSDFCALAKSLRNAPIAGADETLVGKAQRTALIEILLNDDAHPLDKFVAADRREQGNALLRATRLRVQLGFLGLMYFLVYHGIAMLRRRGGIDVTKAISVFVCGNGSKLFKLFCLDSDVDHKIFTRLIETWLGDVGFTAPCIVFTVTDNPKREVAIGALSWEPLKEDNWQQSNDPGGGRAGIHAAVAGVAEAPHGFGTPDGAGARQTGTIEDFCTQVKEHFEQHLPSLYDPRVLAQIKTSSDLEMEFPDQTPAFVGFTGETCAREQDPRRRFVLDLKAVLEKWATLERT